MYGKTMALKFKLQGNCFRKLVNEAGMSQIKSRLKAAYENVELHASSTWVHSPNAFQNANQELYVRESKMKEALAVEPTRPRTVRDRIPHSRLAQYSNYEYNESRELCYASSATTITFCYPCGCKRSSIKEPWMIPEVEQLLIWYSHAPAFNILELLRLEELGHLDDQEELTAGRNLDCRLLHEISPVFYETVERTPGKSRYTSCAPISPADLHKFIPSQLKTETFEDMILRMKIESDEVRDLWSDRSRHVAESVLKESKSNLLKSPLGNYFLLDDSEDTTTQYDKQTLTETRTVNDHHLKSTDFAQLQNLADSFRELHSSVCNVTRLPAETSFSAPNDSSLEPQEVAPKTDAAPTRRLYSSVLQGLATDTKQLCSTDIASASNSSAKGQSSLSVSSVSPPKTTTSSCFSTENSFIPPLTPTHKSTPIPSKSHTPSVNSPSQRLTQSSHWGTATSPTKSYAQVSRDRTKPAPVPTNSTLLKPYQKTEIPSVPSNLTSSTSNTTNTTTCADACTASAVNSAHKVSCSPTKTANMPSYCPCNAYLGNTYTNNNTYFNNSMYSNNNNYFNNSYYCNSHYALNFQNGSFTGTSFSNNVYANNTYQSNQFPSLNSRTVFPQFNRQPYSSNQPHISSPHPTWLFQHNRLSPTPYPFAHFAAQPYLVLSPSRPPLPPVPLPPRQNQRWTPPTQYIRTPSTLPSYHMPVTQHTSSSLSPQHGGMQNQDLCRANSSQHTSSLSQQFLENLPGRSARAKPKSKNDEPAAQMGFVEQKARGKSPEGSSATNENVASVEVSSETYSSISMSYSKRSSAGLSDVASPPPLEKPLLIKSAASASSLDYRRTKVCNDCIDCEYSSVEIRASAVAVENSSYFSSDAEELYTLLPLSTSVSEELERQALEQYQPSDENFYRELERQAEEQYDQDYSENWRSPPNESLLFGGQTIRAIPAITKHCFFFFGGC